jgi:V8-like Glu-specific endopeptidase
VPSNENVDKYIEYKFISSFINNNNYNTIQIKKIVIEDMINKYKELKTLVEVENIENETEFVINNNGKQIEVNLNKKNNINNYLLLQ